MGGNDLWPRFIYVVSPLTMIISVPPTPPPYQNSQSNAPQWHRPEVPELTMCVTPGALGASKCSTLVAALLD